MFSKIDKKVLTIALVFFIAVLLIIFFISKVFNINNSEVQNSLGGVNTESMGN